MRGASGGLIAPAAIIQHIRQTVSIAE